MIIVDDYRNVINSMLHPGAATKKTMDIGEAIVYFWKGAAIPFILLFLESLLLGGLIGALLSSLLSSVPGLGALLGAGLAVFVIVYFVILVPIAIIVGAAILHFFGRYIFKFFKNGFNNTLSAIAYGETAAFSLAWLGPLAIISCIWGFIVEILALANQQAMSSLKAFGTILLTIIVVWIIEAIVLFAAHL